MLGAERWNEDAITHDHVRICITNVTGPNPNKPNVNIS